MHVVNGMGWVVSGNQLYKVPKVGSPALAGSIPGQGRVTMVHNDTQMVIMHNFGWHVLTIATESLIAVPESPTTAQGTYQDTYVVFPKEDGTYGWSHIDDAQTLDALDFASAEAQPDPIIAVLSDHRELWLFGT
jgi:hypothetical protein